MYKKNRNLTTIVNCNLSHLERNRSSEVIMNYIIEYKKKTYNPESIMHRINFNPINLNTGERTSGNECC